MMEMRDLGNIRVIVGRAMRSSINTGLVTQINAYRHTLIAAVKGNQKMFFKDYIHLMSIEACKEDYTVWVYEWNQGLKPGYL
jgi:hypothetical protein